MGGMTQALRTRPGEGARCQGNRVLGLLSPGTPSERSRLCNKDTNSHHTARTPESLGSRLRATLPPVVGGNGQGHSPPQKGKEHLVHIKSLSSGPCKAPSLGP